MSDDLIQLWLKLYYERDNDLRADDYSTAEKRAGHREQAVADFAKTL